MTDRELRRLRRDDLLQILIDQQRQNDEMAEALKRAQAELQDKRIAIEESGSVAEAAMKLNGVFQAAQAAADEYTAQCRSRAEALQAQAQAEADRAKRLADDVVNSARREADRILSDARAQAERLLAEAGNRSEPTGVGPEPQQEDDGGKRRHGLLLRKGRA